MGTTAEYPGRNLAQPLRPLLEVQTRFSPTLPLVRLSGVLGPNDLPIVRDTLDEVVERFGRASLVVLDLRRLVRCDSLAAAGLARLIARVHVDGGEVRLQGPTDLVTEIEQRAATWTEWRSGE